MVDRQGRVKLLDFGLGSSRGAFDESMETSLGRLLGTLDYMAPEGGLGAADRPACGSLRTGATLFLSAHRPRAARRFFPKRSLMDHLNALAAAEVPRVSTLRADIPSELDDSSAGSSAATHTIALSPRRLRKNVPLGLRRPGETRAEIRRSRSIPKIPAATAKRQTLALRVAEQRFDGIASAPTVSLFDQDEPKEARKGIGRRWDGLSPQRLQPEPSLFGATIVLKTPEGCSIWILEFRLRGKSSSSRRTQ